MLTAGYSIRLLRAHSRRKILSKQSTVNLEYCRRLLDCLQRRYHYGGARSRPLLSISRYCLQGVLIRPCSHSKSAPPRARKTMGNQSRNEKRRLPFQENVSDV